MNNIIFIGTNYVNLTAQKDRHLPFKAWKGDPNDREIPRIIPFLRRLALVNGTSEVIKEVVTNNFLDYDKVQLFLEPHKIYSFPREWKIPKQPPLLSDTQFKFRFTHWNIQAQKLTNKFIYPHVKEEWLDWDYRFLLIK